MLGAFLPTFCKGSSMLGEIELNFMSVLDSLEKPFVRNVSVLEGDELKFVSMLASLEKTH